jgi:hypothetical protein
MSFFLHQIAASIVASGRPAAFVGVGGRHVAVADVIGRRDTLLAARREDAPFAIVDGEQIQVLVFVRVEL